MSNSVQTNKSASGIIAKMAAGFLEDNLQFVKTIDKADESDFDGKNGYMAGDTIQIAQPARFTNGTTADITSTIQDVVEPKIPLQLAYQYNVPIAFTSAEIATDLALKAWAKRVLKPAMITLANNVEKQALALAVAQTWSQVGSAGSTVFDTDTILSAGQKMDEQGCADFDNRYVLLNPAGNRSAVNARKGLFQQSTAISEQYKSGAMGTADGFTFLRNNLLPSLTTGTANTTGVTAGANLTNASATVSLAGLGNALTVTAGTRFTIAGIYDVHPVTKATLSSLKQFVITTGGTSSAGGALDVTVAPTVYSSTGNGLQNVSSLAANGAVVTFLNGAAGSTYAQNLAFHKSAFRFCSVPLVMPDGLDMAAQETYKGITVRVIRDYDVLKDRLIMRADILWGLAAKLRPEYAAVITA